MIPATLNLKLTVKFYELLQKLVTNDKNLHNCNKII
jgi:hypothetical protein